VRSRRPRRAHCGQDKAGVLALVVSGNLKANAVVRCFQLASPVDAQSRLM